MTSHSIAAKQGSTRFKFIGNIIAELKKVVWLSRREWIYLTVLVLIVAVCASILLGAFDYAFSSLVDKLLLAK